MNLLRTMIASAHVERPARRALRLVRRRVRQVFRRPTEWERRVARDDACIERILRDRLTPHSPCIDIGAHDGLFLDAFLHRAPRARHVAFEPLPEHAARLRQRYPGVRVHACALGDRSGEVEFHQIEGFPAWSGLHPQAYPPGARVVPIKVPIRRLDEMLAEGERVEFIKIDVEGAEHEVLRGAIQTLERHRPWILFEHARIHAGDSGSEPAAIHDLLVRHCNLRIHTLEGAGPLSRQQFCDIVEASHASNYDRHAHTNFVARTV